APFRYSKRLVAIVNASIRGPPWGVKPGPEMDRLFGAHRRGGLRPRALHLLGGALLLEVLLRLLLGLRLALVLVRHLDPPQRPAVALVCSSLTSHSLR